MIKHDYKPQNDKRLFKSSLSNKLPAWATHPFMIIFMAALIMALAIFLSSDQPLTTNNSEIVPPSNTQTDYNQGEIQLYTQLDTNTQSDENQTDLEESPSNYSEPIEIPLEIVSSQQTTELLSPFETQDKWQSAVVKKGDNLSLIFKRIGLTPQMVHKIINLDDNTKKLKSLRPGEIIHYQLDKNNKLTNLKYVIDLQNTLYIFEKSISKDNNDYTSNIVNKNIESRTAYISGTITDSLYMSGKRAGLTDTLVINLANIFDWDIDFILDIRVGDNFSVLYEEQFLDGEKIGNGQIIAAEFINQGDSYQAVRYTDSKGDSSYYNPNGLSMRKAFLRAPIKFSYISSGFKPRRFHPIQKRWKAHRGVDYRANTGTPIRAAGDGTVTHSSYNKYNGKYVFIQHGQGIVTKYLHMSRRAVSRGKKVKQGQVIGYVGSTGMSEAPHLHYEFLVNGVHRNPRTVKLPKAEPISKSEKTAFMKISKSLVNQLETRKSIQNTPQMAK